MREILFRGIDAQTGEWIHGDLIKGEHTYISSPENFYNAVVSITGRMCTLFNIVCPETVGQYTGLTDKNGKKIFEGDIVKISCNSFTEKLGQAKGEWKSVVAWNKIKACFEIQHHRERFAPLTWTFNLTDFNGKPYSVEITGNIHEPEPIDQRKE